LIVIVLLFVDWVSVVSCAAADAETSAARAMVYRKSLPAENEHGI
jgi:hypothetical protein